MKKFVLSAAIAAAAVMVATSAFAAPNAVVTRDSDVYKTRTGNQVVNEVEEDELVEVLECRGNRCKVKIPGPDGWMRKNRLVALDDEGEPDPGISFGITIGPGGPGISIGVGDGSSGVSIGGGGGPSSGPRVCVFDGDGYSGAGRCFAPGTTVNNLSSLGWNDVVNSIRVYGGAGAQICDNAGGGGSCYNVNVNTTTLGGFNDQASYIDVY
jgi:hypothetical protein